MREHETTQATGSGSSGGSGPGVALGAAAAITVLAMGVLPAVWAPQAAAAQQPDTMALSLDRAIVIAEGNNPAYRRALNQLEVGGPESRATWMGQVLPNVNLTVLNTGYGGNLQRQSVDNFGNPIENEISEWVFNSNTRQDLSLNWSIQGASLFNSLRNLDLDDRGRDLAVERSAFTTGSGVQRQYFAVLRQRQLLADETAGLESLERDLEDAERLYRVAERSRVDVLNAELAIEDQLRLIQQQQRAFDQSRLALRTTLGDPELPPFHLEDVELPLFDPSALEEDGLVERALSMHPDVRQAQLDLDQASVDVSEAKGNRWPSLNLQYRLGRSAYTVGNGGALFDLTHEPDELSNSFSVGVSVPYLNNYFQNRSGEVQAEVALRNQREAVKETRLQVEQQVRSQLIELRNQYETFGGSERRHEIAQEALDLAREEYRLGVGTFQALDDQVQAERTARRDLLTARFGFVDALLNLEEAVGGPVGPSGGAAGSGEGTASGGGR